MGSRPSADIFYGIVLEENDEALSDQVAEILNSGNWDREYLRRVGQKLSEEEDGYLAREELITKLSGCILERWGYDGSNSYFLAIKESHLHGDWDQAETLDAGHFKMNYSTLSDWNQKLQGFCQVLGITWKEPAWRMVCSYD